MERRIVIYGVCGSGKTFLAKQVAERLGHAFIEADFLTWEPGWIEVPPFEQRKKIAAVCSGEAWVLDTMYSKWMEISLERADLLVCLDYPRHVSLLRLIRRTIARCRDRHLICNGNIESWRTTFSKDSILIWHYKSFDAKRGRIRAWKQKSPGPRVVVLKSPKECQQWLDGLSQG